MNKVILITGCSSGIGRDLAQRLSQSGHTVVATARSCGSHGWFGCRIEIIPGCD